MVNGVDEWCSVFGRQEREQDDDWVVRRSRAVCSAEMAPSQVVFCLSVVRYSNTTFSVCCGADGTTLRRNYSNCPCARPFLEHRKGVFS